MNNVSASQPRDLSSNPTWVMVLIPDMTPVLLIPGSGLESDLDKL